MTVARRARRRRLLAPAALLVLLGAGLLAQGGYIHAKAWLAQILIGRAWAEAQAGHAEARPWPWSDAWPVARLGVPRLGIDQYVLSEASGRALAFGPGHHSGTVLPGEDGASVVAGHRDTHFRFLKDLRAGDEIVIERSNGDTRTYRVAKTEIVDARTARLRTDGAGARIALVTCYPFDTPVPGGPLRYVVTATNAP